MTRLVADACPVIFLAKLDGLDLVRSLFPGPVLVPSRVRRELGGNAIPPGERQRLDAFLRGCRTAAASSPTRPSAALSLADRELLAIARRHRKTAVILTDDSLVRRIALAEGIPVAGTLGILVRAVRSGLLDACEAIRRVDELVDRHRFRISTDLYRESLRLIHESAATGKKEGVMPCPHPPPAAPGRPN